MISLLSQLFKLETLIIFDDSTSRFSLENELPLFMYLLY